jgi:hypothetical protein
MKLKICTAIIIGFYLPNPIMAQGDYKSHIFNSSAVVNSKPVLFNDISFNSGELLAANFLFTNKDNTQKVVFKPLGLTNASKHFWRDTKLNFAQKDGITTIGMGLTYDNTAAYNESRINRVLASNVIPSFSCNAGEQADACEKRKAVFVKNTLNPAIVKILQERLKNSYSITAGYNISLFGIVGGDKVLNDENLIGNKYNIKAHNFSADFSFSFNERSGISFGGIYKRKRKSSVENQKMINYYGVNFTFAQWFFALDKDYKDSDDYNKNLFASSVYWGLSFEYQKADGDSQYYEDGIKKYYILTPFLDFRISPKSQFRLGIPIKRYESVSKKLVELGPFIQYAIQLTDKS